MRKLKFQILGKPWTLRLLKKRKYKQKNGSDSVAVTDVNKRRIDLGPKGRDLETITHELFHAFLGECCTHSADLDEDSFEEICAELVAKRGQELLNLASELHMKAGSGVLAPSEEAPKHAKLKQ